MRVSHVILFGLSAYNSDQDFSSISLIVYVFHEVQGKFNDISLDYPLIFSAGFNQVTAQISARISAYSYFIPQISNGEVEGLYYKYHLQRAIDFD